MSHVPEHDEVAGVSEGKRLAWPIVSLVTHPDFHVGDLDDNPETGGNVGAADFRKAKAFTDANRKKRNKGRA